jgi:hypothetical protein
MPCPDFGAWSAIPACHHTSVCTPSVPYVDSDSNPTWLIVNSFLSGTDDWKTVGVPSDQDAMLSIKAGILVAVKDEFDHFIEVSQVTASGMTLNRGLFDSTGLFYADFVPAGEYTLQASASFPLPARTITLVAGKYTAVTLKPGPLIFVLSVGHEAAIELGYRITPPLLKSPRDLAFAQRPVPDRHLIDRSGYGEIALPGSRGHCRRMKRRSCLGRVGTPPRTPTTLRFSRKQI